MKATATLLTLVLVLHIILASCNKKDKCPNQNVTMQDLQGHWKQAPSDPNALLFAGDEYEYFFEQDSFKMIRLHFDDISHDEHGCYTGRYYEYARGAYNVVNDSLYFVGVYTEADYSIKDSGCYHIGAYADKFKAQRKCDELNMVAYESFTMNKEQ